MRLASVAGAAVLTILLTACGGPESGAESGSGGGSEAEPPSQAELESYQEQAGTDVQSVADDAIAEFESSGSLPESADGLGTLSEGNEVASYEVDGTTAEICVEQVVDGVPVAFVSWYVDTATDPARSSELSKGLNAGCP